MKKLILISLILFFIVPVFAEESKLKLSFENKPKASFQFLQFSSCVLIYFDTICTYNSVWNYGRGELNPYLRGLLDYPEAVFLLHTTMNLGIVWFSSALYERNKFLAYSFLIVINAVKLYFICDHIRSWKN